MFFNRFFRQIYSCPDILSCINIRMCFKTTMRTFKRFAVSGTKIMTMRTCLRSICWINGDYRNAIKFCFILNLCPKVCKIPFANAGTKFLSLIIGGFANTFKLFKSNSLIFLYSIRNDFLCNSVIHDRSCSFLFSRKPFQDLFAALCAFGLETRTNLLTFFSVCFKLFAGHYFTGRQRGNIDNAKVYSDKFFDIMYNFFWYFNGLKKKPFALFGNKVGFTFNVRKIFLIVTDKRNLQSSIDRPDRNNILFIRKDAGIIGNTTFKPENSFNIFIELIRIGYLGNTTNNSLCCKMRKFFLLMVNQIMKLKLIECFCLPCCFRNIIASGITSLQGFPKTL